jgi:hypothetical protein
MQSVMAASEASSMTRELTSRIDNALRVWPPRVMTAALAFEACWTRNALRRVAPELADRLDQQSRLYKEAVEDGTAEQIEMHGGGMCRGYAVCAAALQAAGMDDDAYLIGVSDGATVAIGDARAAVDRVKEKFGNAVVFITPDEVAEMVAKLPAVGDVKRAFPGAEIVEIKKSGR